MVVRETLKRLHVKYVYVNCFTAVDNESPNSIYSYLHSKLCSKYDEDNADTMPTYIEPRFALKRLTKFLSDQSKEPAVIVLDEVDNLMPKDKKAILGQLLEWPIKYSVILITISNAPELYRSMGKPDLSITKVAFPSYTMEETQNIIEHLIRRFPHVMEKKAVELASIIGSSYGDIRRSIQLVVESLSVVAEYENDDLQVTIADVKEAAQAMEVAYDRIIRDSILNLGGGHRTVLTMLVWEMHSEDTDAVTLSQVCQNFENFREDPEMHPILMPGFSEVCQSIKDSFDVEIMSRNCLEWLVEMGILYYGPRDKFKLKFPLDQVVAILETAHEDPTLRQAFRALFPKK